MEIRVHVVFDDPQLTMYLRGLGLTQAELSGKAGNVVETSDLYRYSIGVKWITLKGNAFSDTFDASQLS